MDEIKYTMVPAEPLLAELRKRARGKTVFVRVASSYRADCWQGSDKRRRFESDDLLPVPLKTAERYLADLVQRLGARKPVVKIGESSNCFFFGNVYDSDQDPTP